MGAATPWSATLNEYPKLQILTDQSSAELPDSITIEEFLRNEKYGRCELKSSRNPYTCGLTGKTYTAVQALERVDHLARALRKRLHFEHSDGSEWDRVVCLYSFNTVSVISPAQMQAVMNGTRV